MITAALLATGFATSSAAMTLAVPPPPQAERVQLAQAIATRVWGAPRCGAATIKWVDFRSQGSIDSRDLAVTWTDRCEVWLNTRYRNRQPYGLLRWGRLCSTLLHEYGHLAGYRDPTNPSDPRHSSNPLSIMYGGAAPDRDDDGEQDFVHRDGRWLTRRGYDRRCDL